MDNNNKQSASDKNEKIKELGAVTLRKRNKNIFCLNIIGEIEGHNVLNENVKTTKYEHVIPQLIAVEEDDTVDGVLIVLNTVGGDVEAGLAIAELIAGMHKPTVSYVLGGGHSIGVPLAVSAKRSFIAPSATMTVHPVRTSGLVLGVEQSFKHFEKMQDRIINFITDNSKITKEKFNKLLLNTDEMVTDIGTTLDGKQAVEVGLIDCVGSVYDVLECLYNLIDSN